MNWQIVFGIFVFLESISEVICATQKLTMNSCYTAPFKGPGFRLVGGTIRGKVNCTNFFEPPSNDYYLSVRINSLNLKKVGNSCPHFDIISYTSKRIKPEPDLKAKGWEVLEPKDPNYMKRFSCKTFTDKLLYQPGMFVDTSAPGQKLMVQYNADSMNPEKDPFDITISSFVKGAAWRCPDDHYRCWEEKFKCLDRELECDGEDNCYDNSDENDFYCTGRLAGMKLPVFLIFLLAIVLVLTTFIVILVMTIINRRKRNKRNPRNAWGDRTELAPPPEQMKTLSGPYPHPNDDVFS